MVQRRSPFADSPRKVFVVDADQEHTRLLRRPLEKAGYFVEAFTSGETFLARHGADDEGCLLLEQALSGVSGLDVQAALGKAGSVLPVIFILARADVPVTVAAVRAGAADVLTKPVEEATLLSLVETAMELYEQREMSLTDVSDRVRTLTDRERVVMEHVVRGLSNKDIAQHLGISHRTVEIHRARLMLKTRTSNLLALRDLYQRAARYKLVTPLK